MLRRMFGLYLKREEVTLHNEELHNLCASPDIVRTMKTRRMRLAEHVARGEVGNA
jgi:hypothetical protein